MLHKTLFINTKSVTAKASLKEFTQQKLSSSLLHKTLGAVFQSTSVQMYVIYFEDIIGQTRNG